MENTAKQKIIVIVGPTASGKTGLAVELAKHFNGEVISADSRQVYRGLDIGTEKVTTEEMDGIQHHLIDIRDPSETYSASDFLRDTDAAIGEIAARGNLPIVAGGTYFYVSTLLGNQSVSEVAPNETLRNKLETKDTDDLFGALVRLDPDRAATIDRNNRRRLIRALEIINALGYVPKTEHEERYDALVIGIETEPAQLRARIDARLDETLAKGLVEETRTLLKKGISKERLDEIGLEYRVVLRHLGGELTEAEMRTELRNKLWQYAKRQLTWLKRDADIKWFARDNVAEIKKTTAAFLEKKIDL